MAIEPAPPHAEELIARLDKRVTAIEELIKADAAKEAEETASEVKPPAV